MVINRKMEFKKISEIDVSKFSVIDGKITILWHINSYKDIPVTGICKHNNKNLFFIYRGPMRMSEKGESFALYELSPESMDLLIQDQENYREIFGSKRDHGVEEVTRPLDWGHKQYKCNHKTADLLAMEYGMINSKNIINFSSTS